MIIKRIQSLYHQYGLLKLFSFSLSEIRIRWINPFFYNSFSQFGEDIWMDEYFHHKRKGFYIDIGAYDPFRFSNTMRFYKKGWHGINIEPNKERFVFFEKYRPFDINLNMGVGTKKQMMIFYRFDPPTLSTFSSSQADTYNKQGFHLVQKEPVGVDSLEHICKAYVRKQHIDFLSIDVEGLELDVLKSNIWTRYTPQIICIESASASEVQGNSRDREIQKFLTAKGYHLIHETETNAFYEYKGKK
ncbi:MAG: FkbM family methyltransferase [Rhodanobacter sp.]|jgi:FkbM family methyltransferase